MKIVNVFILFFFAYSNITAQDIQVKSITPITTSQASFLSFHESIEPTKVLEDLIKQGAWMSLKQKFISTQLWEDFFEKLSYQMNEKTFPNNATLLRRIKPYVYKRTRGSTIVLLNILDSTTAELDFDFIKQGNSFQIQDYKVGVTKSKASKGRFSHVSVNSITAAFVRLPNYANDYPEYYDNVLDAYNQNKFPNGEVNDGNVNFHQIDFTPLKIKFRWCRKVLGINICGDKTEEFSYGKVISGKDIPGNENTFNDRYFGNITDLTAYTQQFGLSDYLEHSYVQTAVVVDGLYKNLTFFREGLEPWKFQGSGAYEFYTPIAIKEIGGYLYVLDRGDGAHQADIKVFQLIHTPDGNYSINPITIINQGNTNISFQNPVDIGGYELQNGQKVVLLADDIGLHSIQLTANNQLLGINKTFLTIQDPYTSSKFYGLQNIVKLDASTNSETTVILTNSNEIISFSNSETSTHNNNFVKTSYYTKLGSSFYTTNLAYMVAEEKWYVTDLSGRMHTLTKEGRYVTYGGQTGISEDNGELYKPFAITPNTILDNTNDYRFRFIVGNEWTYNTGFKLFAPALSVPEFKVFENLNTGNLTFTFNTSGKWYHVENSRSVQLISISANGVTIQPDKWNTQLNSNIINDPSIDFLTAYPNIVQFNKADLFLKRGWNKAELKIKITKNGEPDEIITKTLDFYWLPSNFNPSNDLSNDEYKLNNSNFVSGTAINFIYKPIIVGDKGAFIARDKVKVTSKGKITFLNGSTFYNFSNNKLALNNIEFQDTTKFVIDSGAYLCINVLDTNFIPVFSKPVLNNHLSIHKKYNLGLNPLVPFSSDIVSDCKSPCFFLEENKPKVQFNTLLNKISGLGFEVLADPNGTTYSEKVKWEIEKIIPNNTNTNYSALIIDSLASKINLKKRLNYNFEPCSEYKITLSIGCNDIDWINPTSIVVNTFPKISLGADTSLCEGTGNFQLSNFSPIGGIWSGVGVSSGGLVNLNQMPMSVNDTLTYTFTDEFGCSKSDTKILKLYPTPATPTLSSNSPVCELSKLEINANYRENSTYIITLPNGKNYKISNNLLNIYYAREIEHNGVFKVKVISNGCSSPESSIHITVHPLPNVMAGSDTIVCKFSPQIWLTTGRPISGGSGFWSGKGVGNYVFVPTSAGEGIHTLTYTFTDTNGCRNSASKKINVGPMLTAQSQTFCSNSPASQLGGVNPTGGTWSGTAVSSTGLFSPSTSVIGTQQLTYTINMGGCSNSTIQNIYVNPAPVAPSLIAQPAFGICEQGLLELNPSVAIPGYTYRITGPNGYNKEGLSQKIYNLKPSLHTGQYTIKAMYNGCESTPTANSILSVNVHPLPTVDAGSDVSLCANAPNLPLVGNPSGGTWLGDGYKRDTIIQQYPRTTGGAPAPRPVPRIGDVFSSQGMQAGRTYTLRYTYTQPNTGCSSSDLKAINLASAPSAYIESSTDSITCSTTYTSTTLACVAQGSYDYQYRWQKNQVDIPNSSSPVINVNQSGTYTCLVSSACGATTASYNLRVGVEWKSIAAGHHIVFGATSDGHLWRWGEPAYLNQNTWSNRKPSKIDSLNNWKKIYSNNENDIFIGLKRDGTLWELGIYEPFVAKQIGTESMWKKIALSYSKLLGLKADGTIWYLGNIDFYQGGYANIISLNPPSQIGNDNDWKEIAASSAVYYAIKNDGTLWSWGIDFCCLDSNIRYCQRSIPTRIGNDYNWEKIFCNGAWHDNTFGIKNDLSLWSWGRFNLDKQLGRNANLLEEVCVPALVDNINKWYEISIGYNHAVGLDTDGNVYYWGNNNGVGTNQADNGNPDIGVPTKSSLPKAQLLVTGKDFTIATFSCNTELCGRGNNYEGQLGNGNSKYNSMGEFEKNYYTEFECIGGIPSDYPGINGNARKGAIENITGLQGLLGSPFPNPNTGLFSVEYRVKDAVKSRIVVYDILKLLPIKEFVITGEKANGILNIDLSALPNGVYPISLLVDEKPIVSRKIILIK